MGLSDPIKGALAPHLAAKQSRKLQKAEAGKTDAMRQQDYEAARKSMLGEFSSQPLSAVQPCAANAKAARRKERLDLVSRAIVSCPEHANEAARLRGDMDEVENMRCAKHVYLKDEPDMPEAPPGFKKPTPEQLADLGLTQDQLTPKGSQFKAAVYLKDPAVWGENPKPAAVVAFRGSTPEKEDWDNNFAQDANREAPYYRRAVQIGNKLAETGSDVQIVGHSLGGGLASAAQGGSGLPCSTYNSAGLHPSTVQRYSADKLHTAADSDKIKAIRVEGEVLTRTQETGLLGLMANDAVGSKRDLAPSLSPKEFDAMKAAGKVDPNDGYSDYLHGMDGVIASMEQQKTADEAALRGCLSNQA
jgi:hypothetical protein